MLNRLSKADFTKHYNSVVIIIRTLPDLNNSSSANFIFLTELLLNSSMVIPNDKLTEFHSLKSFLNHEDSRISQVAHLAIGLFILRIYSQDIDNGRNWIRFSEGTSTISSISSAVINVSINSGDLSWSVFKIVLNNSAQLDMELELGGKDAIHHGLSHIAAEPIDNIVITKLRCFNSGINEAGIKAVNKILASGTQLKQISLQFDDVTEATKQEFLQALKAKSTLNEITVSGFPLNRSAIETLVEILTYNTKLTGFGWQSCSASDFTSESIDKVIQLISNNFDIESFSLGGLSYENTGRVLEICKRNAYLKKIEAAANRCLHSTLNELGYKDILMMIQNAINRINEAILAYDSSKAQQMLFKFKQLAKGITFKYLQQLMDDLDNCKTIAEKQTKCQESIQAYLLASEQTVSLSTAHFAVFNMVLMNERNSSSDNSVFSDYTALMRSITFCLNSNGKLVIFDDLDNKIFCKLILSLTNNLAALAAQTYNQHSVLQYFLLKYIKDMRLPKIKDGKIKYLANPGNSLSPEINGKILALTNLIGPLNEYNENQVTGLWEEALPLLTGDLSNMMSVRLKSFIKAVSNVASVEEPTLISANTTSPKL